MVGRFLLLGLLSFPAFALDCQFKSQADLGNEVLDEIERAPFTCSKQKVHLTFDDGPSVSSTPQILKELNLRGIKASFFVTTSNLDPKNKNAVEHAKIVKEVMNSGHLIADHGHDHNAYDLRCNADGQVLEKGFSQEERENQIKRSINLLNSATENKFNSQSLKLYRFPYGRGAMPSEKELLQMEEKKIMKFSSEDYPARLAEYRKQSPALQTLAGNGFSHLGWNHDSHDSSFGLTINDRNVLKNYILKNIKSLCQAKMTQVALFHDIKLFNAEAIPVIADIGKCMGLKFVTAAEMHAEKEPLEKTGVYLTKEFISKGPVDSIGNLLQSIEKNEAPKQECKPAVKKVGCFSEQYQKYYKDCEGGDSICLGGRWYSRRDPIVVNNCNLKDE